MTQKLNLILDEAGLTEDESRVYLALSNSDQQSAAFISSITGLNLMTTYRIIKRLVSKGFIKEVPINKKQTEYKAQPLSKIIKSIDDRYERYLRLKKMLSIKTGDDLTNIDQSSIELVEGIENVKATYLNMPDEADEELLVFGSIINLWDHFGWDLDAPEERAFIRNRHKNGIYARVLHTEQDGAEEIVRRDSIDKRSTKIKDNLPVTKNNLVISESQAKLFISDAVVPYAIVVNQPELVNIYKHHFQTIWTGS